MKRISGEEKQHKKHFNSEVTLKDTTKKAGKMFGWNYGALLYRPELLQR